MADLEYLVKSQRFFSNDEEAGELTETLVDMFQAPAGRGTLVEIFLCNQSATVPAKVRIALAPNSEDDDRKHYLLYDYEMPIGMPPYKVYTLTLNQADLVRAYVSPTNAEVSIQVIPNETQQLYG